MIQTIITHSACLIVGAVVGIVALALFIGADDRDQSRPEGWPERSSYEDY